MSDMNNKLPQNPGQAEKAVPRQNGNATTQPSTDLVISRQQLDALVTRASADAVKPALIQNGNRPTKFTS